MVSRLSRRRFVAAAGVAVAISAYAYLHLNPWIWWLPILAGLVVDHGIGLPAGNCPVRTGSIHEDVGERGLSRSRSGGPSSVRHRVPTGQSDAWAAVEGSE